MFRRNQINLYLGPSINSMKKNKKVSLKDIAKEVGVSIATVSYVLSTGKGGRVSEEMAKKIKEVAKKWNYRPNRIAQSLKSGKTNTIGLILADISNPFFASIARIIEDEAAKLKYTVIFGSSDEKAEKSLHLIDFLSSRQVDGFIIAPSKGSESQIKNLISQNIPVVLIDRHFPKIDSNYVVVNNYKASYEAVEEMVSAGKKRIAMLAYSGGLFHMEERIRGYQTVLKENGLEPDSRLLKKIDFENIAMDVKSAIDTLVSLQAKVDAIFFATNTLAIHGLKYLNELNLKVPTDVAIVSFDEGEAFDFYYCPLTHVRQPLLKMGKKAVQVLIDQIADADTELRQVCIDAELIIRESSG